MSENVDIVRRMWDAWDRPDDLRRLVAPDSVWVPLTGSGDELRGPDELVAWLADQRWAGRRLVPTLTRVEERGDRVIAFGSVRVYESDGAFAEVSATWVYEVRDGAVRRAEGFSSLAAAEAAVLAA